MHISKIIEFDEDLLKDYDPDEYVHPAELCFYNVFSENFGLDDFTGSKFKASPPTPGLLSFCLKNIHAKFDTETKGNKFKISITSVNKPNLTFYFWILCALPFPVIFLLIFFYYPRSDSICDQALINAVSQLESELQTL